MKLVSIETIPGQEFEALDIVRGTVVYSKNFGRDFMAGKIGRASCRERV